jgi:hypothetical protein
MTHWMEGDWPDAGEDTPEIKAMKRLLKVAKEVISKCSIDQDVEDVLMTEFDGAINDAEAFLYPEDDDPRSNGWVGDDGLP